MSPMIEILGFFFTALLAARLMATWLPAPIAGFAVTGFLFGVWYFGPLFCGERWSDVSLFLGASIGGFLYTAYERQREYLDREMKKAGLRPLQFPVSLTIVLILLIALVVSLGMGR